MDVVTSILFFFFNDTATTEIYTLSLHDALPICPRTRHLSRPRLRRPEHRRSVGPTWRRHPAGSHPVCRQPDVPRQAGTSRDRKSTRLNSSHSQISYAVFCLKKKKKKKQIHKINK